MSTKEEQLATVVKTTAVEVIKRPPRKATIDEVDAAPRRAVEVVSKEEEKHQRQLAKKAKKPATCFTSSSATATRQILGAEVDTETLFGFLSAAEKVIHVDKSSPILSSIRLSYESGADKMLVEASATNIWTVVAVKATPRGDQGFEVMVPAKRARGVVNTMRDSFKTLSVGMSDGGFWIGHHCIPSGGNVRDLPSRPLLREWEARAVVPAFYFEEICSRVLPVASKDPTKPGLHGAILDFAVARDRTISCTAVSSDGARMHMLELPQMRIQTRGHTSPPSLMISEVFFRYLRSVANREWTALELSETQVNARGEDYQAVATATMKGLTNTRGLATWRSANVEHDGYWVVDRKDLDQVLRKVAAEGGEEIVTLRLNAMRDQLDVWFSGQENHTTKESISAKRFGGSPAVDVPFNAGFVLAAVTACKSGLIQLGFSGTKDQGRSPVTIRGEDDQFKAIVMPVDR